MLLQVWTPAFLKGQNAVKKLFLIIGVCIALLVGFTYWLSPGNSQEVVFSTEPVVLGNLAEVVSTTGPLSPVEVTLVSSLIPGNVKHIYPNADFNHHVEEGEPLVLLDQQHAQAKLHQAEAAVTSAKADLSRARAARDAAKVAVDIQQQLRDKMIGKIEDYEEAKYKFASAKAAVEAAESMIERAKAALREAQLGVEYTVIRAPAAGIIIDRNVIEGQNVGPQLPKPLFTIASDLGRMQVIAQVVEGDISKVRAGMQAEFTVYAYTDDDVKFEGKVKQIRYMPTNVQGAVFYPTIIEVENRRVADSNQYVASLLAVSRFGPLHSMAWYRLVPEKTWMLRPGMTATVEIVRRRHLDVWKVPTEALNFVLEDDYKSSEAEARYKKMKKQFASKENWQPIWIEDPKTKRPWPVFVRVRGVNSNGDTGIKDGHYNEVLEWEPDYTPNPASPPQVIISAPPTKNSFWDKKLKIGAN
ncbi:MAG: efflux RND transporter periplasmic adaptor subunit [Gemmataceae bacterium]